MVLQLLAATERTGQLEVRGDGGEQRGFLGLSGGGLVSAQFEDEDGELALGAVFAIDRGDFEFLPQERVDRRDLEGDLDALLDRAATQRERVDTARGVVTNERVRFRLSERASEGGDVTLTPQQWRALLLIDGERDVAAIAERMSLPRLSAQQLLAGIVRAGFADPAEPPAGAAAQEPPRAYRRLPPMPPIPPTQAGEQVVLLGRLPDFPLETVVQLLAETQKTGRLEVRSGRDRSTLGMSDGRLVSAVYGEEEGEIALGAAFTARDGEFEFVPMASAPAANLRGDLDALLDRAATNRDNIAAIRAAIPSESARFTLSDRAARNPQIVLTPDQWRVLLGVNGERDVAAIADHVRMRRLPVMMVLADLVRGGYVDIVTEQAWPFVERRRAAQPAPQLIEPPPPAPAPIEAPPVTETLEPEEEVAAPVEEVPAPVEEIAEPVEATPVAGVEAPLAETPLDREPTIDDRLAAISGVVGPAEPAPPPSAWEPPPGEVPAPEAAPPEAIPAEAEAAAATAEAFAPTPSEPEPADDPRLAAFGAPPAAEPEAPSWAPQAPEPAPSAWAPPSWEAPAAPEEPPAEVDPRLAAFGAAPEPAAPTWEPPAWEAAAREAPAWEAPAPEAPTWEAAAPEAPAAPDEATVAEEAPAAEAASPEMTWPQPATLIAPPTAPPVPEKKKGLFGGLFGGAKAPPAPTETAIPRAASRPGLLANFANELVAAYNSGHYGKTRVEDRMLNLVMRADEQAEPIDRPLPIANDRLDIGSIDRSALPERQALPYLAVLVRQIYDEAERAFGKDKARRGFRDVRDRLFGKDIALLQAPEVGGRMPKV